jgi:hypothetical protein
MIEPVICWPKKILDETFVVVVRGPIWKVKQPNRS